jgi:hypothetical protein
MLFLGAACSAVWICHNKSSFFLFLFFFLFFFFFFCSILNKLTPEKFDVLVGQLIDSGSTTPDILKVLVSYILKSTFPKEQRGWYNYCFSTCNVSSY